MKSAIYSGAVDHQRYLPVGHGFRYPDKMFYLDLQELTTSDGGSLKSCSRRLARGDHFGEPEDSLADSVRKIVFKRLGLTLRGRICLLTHIRQLGYVMNPVSFFYCWSADDQELEAIVAEVHNTPWGESHCYVMKCEPGETLTFRMPKVFHVSPFMGMEQEYIWSFNKPGDSLRVYMENWEAGEKRFDATLTMRREALKEGVLRRHLWSAPFTSIAVIVRIYLQALNLWMKRCPTFTHPEKVRAKDVSK